MLYTGRPGFWARAGGAPKARARTTIARTVYRMLPPWGGCSGWLQGARSYSGASREVNWRRHGNARPRGSRPGVVSAGRSAHVDDADAHSVDVPEAAAGAH